VERFPSPCFFHWRTIRDFPVPFEAASEHDAFLSSNAPRNTAERAPRNKSFRVLFPRAFILYLIRSKLELAKMPASTSTCSLASNREAWQAAAGNLGPVVQKFQFPALRESWAGTLARTVRTDSDQSASSSLTWSLGGRSPGKVEPLLHLALATLRLVKLSIGRLKFACRPLPGSSSDTRHSWID